MDAEKGTFILVNFQDAIKVYRNKPNIETPLRK